MERWAVKILVLIILFTAAFLSSLLPLKVSGYFQRQGERGVRAISYLVCFGGGVFLAMYLLDMAPDAAAILQENLIRPYNINYNIAEFITACGFILMLISETIVEGHIDANNQEVAVAVMTSGPDQVRSSMLVDVGCQISGFRRPSATTSTDTGFSYLYGNASTRKQLALSREFLSQPVSSRAPSVVGIGDSVFVYDDVTDDDDNDDDDIIAESPEPDNDGDNKEETKNGSIELFNREALTRPVKVIPPTSLDLASRGSPNSMIGSRRGSTEVQSGLQPHKHLKPPTRPNFTDLSPILSIASADALTPLLTIGFGDGLAPARSIGMRYQSQRRRRRRRIRWKVQQTRQKTGDVEATASQIAEAPAVAIASAPHHDHHQAAESLVLLLALSLHHVFEGLSVGLKTTSAAVWHMCICIVSHEVIISFSLGMQLVATIASRRKVVAAAAVCAVMSPIGIAIGIVVQETGGGDSQPVQIANRILQSIATGIFIYVTFFEILQGELSRRDVGSSRMKVAAIIIGFLCISALSLVSQGVNENDDHPEHEFLDTDNSTQPLLLVTGEMTTNSPQNNSRTTNV